MITKQKPHLVQNLCNAIVSNNFLSVTNLSVCFRTEDWKYLDIHDYTSTSLYIHVLPTTFQPLLRCFVSLIALPRAEFGV